MNTPSIHRYFGSQNVPPIHSTLDLIAISRQGITKKAAQILAKELAMSTAELLLVLHVSERTWQRYTDAKFLPQDMTERALQLASLYQLGEEVFGKAEKFRGWLSYPNPIFGGKKPIDLLDSLYGFRAIEEELVRIDYGILA